MVMKSLLKTLEVKEEEVLVQEGLDHEEAPCPWIKMITDVAPLVLIEPLHLKLDEKV